MKIELPGFLGVVTHVIGYGAGGLFKSEAKDDFLGLLAAIKALTPTDSNVIVGNGTTWVAESGSTARTSLGLAIGTDVQAYDAGLAALAAYNTNGILVQTANNTFVGRAITGTANEITSTNGDGVSGAPTLSLPSALTFTGKTITGGTYAGITLSGTSAASAWSNLGTVTTADINGGTLDAVTIGATTPAAAAFTTATMTTAAASTAPISISSTEAGAAAGPLIDFYRNSATPANSDQGPIIRFLGKESGGNAHLYGNILITFADVTDGSEDGTMTFGVSVAASDTTRLTLDAAGATIGGTLTASAGGSLTGTWSNLGTVTTIDINGGTIDGTTIGASSRSTALFTTLGANSTVSFSAGGSMTGTWSDLGTVTTVDINGGTLDGVTIGGASAAAATVTTLTANSTSVLTGTARFGQNTTSAPGAGNNTTGSAIASSGEAYFSSASAGLNVNKTADGNLVGLYSGGNVQGVISISGATVTYGAFSGSHWSQLADGSKPEILRGTILESINQMCAWPGEINERLPCFKVSDTAKAKAVYGVFGWWDTDEGPTNDAFIVSLGAYLIRIKAGETVERGDFIESAGNGCGRVQSNDAMRSSTVAKVTSAEVVDTFPDGSYTVPCTLHCG